MSVLSAVSIRKLQFDSPIFTPFNERKVFGGMSYGISVAGYDVRIAQTVRVEPSKFVLASTIEEFDMPREVIGFVHNKSSWVRRGLAHVNCTVIEPGWRGFLTLELKNHSDEPIHISKGSPIAQIILQWVDEATEGYSGKYQHQESGPQPARFEGGPDA